MSNAISVHDLSKTYPTGKKAVQEISFDIKEGEIFGFLGPNGAGKTTAVKLLTGLLKPTTGNCKIYDIDATRNPEKIHQISGVVTEYSQMYDALSGLDNLIFYSSLFHKEKRDNKKYALDLLKQLDLLDAKDQKLGTYSTGMRQRLSLARAMIHQPKVLFLDEPTSGLDPESILNVNGIIRNLAKQKGVTIFLCTHQLRYAQELCTSYGLIDKGQMFARGTLEELRSQVCKGHTIHMKTSYIPNSIAVKKLDAMYYEFTVKELEEIPSIIKDIVKQGGDIYHVSVEDSTLEEIYFALLDAYRNERKDNHD